MNTPSPELRPSQVTLKTVLTVSFGVLAVVALVYAVVHALLAVALIGASIMIAVALDHAVQLLERRRVNRSLAIAVVFVLLLGLLVGLGFTLIPPVIDQGRELIHDAPSFIRTTRHSSVFHTLDLRFHLGDRMLEAEKKLPELLEGAATPLLSAVGGVLSAVGAIVTVAVLVVFMLMFGGGIVRSIVAEARPEHRRLYENLLEKIYHSIGGYLGGLTLVCCMNGVMATTFLAINRVPFFLPLGILSGFSSMVPYAGPTVIGTTISVIALLTKGTWHGIAAGIYYVAYGFLEGNVISPIVFRRTVHVNPLITTLSILLLGEIAGVVGAIVAVPVAATLQIILRQILVLRREQLALRPGAAAGPRS